MLVNNWHCRVNCKPTCQVFGLEMSEGDQTKDAEDADSEKHKSLAKKKEKKRTGVKNMQSYKHPIENNNVISIFCRIGVCNFQTIGSGRQRIRTSPNTDKDPITRKNVSWPFIQWPEICLIQ